jgi:ATP-dependent helicase YprA (DUF1998 family)
MSSSVEFGVRQVFERIQGRLQRYLEAQYHVRDADLIEERRRVLLEPQGIAQVPFVEVTPSYATLAGFRGLGIPQPIRDLLEELSGWKPSVGVYPPYQHQADALEAFFASEPNDLIVATGTGSGKTETFLYSIVGALALEAVQRKRSFGVRGVRALLLYPMNALVSDQTARLRKLLGDERLARRFRDLAGRHPQFGMYTSRTPYPGTRSGAKDQRHLEKLVGYYEALTTSAASAEASGATDDDKEKAALVKELRRRGRWPAKDIVAFFARHLEQKKIYASGKKVGKEYTAHNWAARFLTHSGDRELLTRQEMQLATPDLLVTNYSMLEYMLLRPIERPIFAQTKRWLESDARNQLLLVLDEAHMYRGVGGAEVGLLIRRLLARLGVGRDRMRCILTSASLGGGDQARAAAEAFARGLTGDGPTRLKVVTGTREARAGARAATVTETEALASVEAHTLAAARVHGPEAHAVVVATSSRLGWPPPPALAGDDLAVRQYVARQLTGFGPLELLIETVAGKATPFQDLARTLFLDHRLAERATDGLLALGSYARRTEKDREEQPLTPTRVHMLFRGLPSLFVCVDPRCTKRRDGRDGNAIAGRMYTEPRARCDCGARVFELFTHRDCGAAYLRAYGAGPEPTFLWHERGGVLTEFGRPLHELHILLEEPHPDASTKVAPFLLDVRTGRVLDPTNTRSDATRTCFLPRTPAENEDNLTTFSDCPVCTRRTRTGGTLKIMDLATKGEQPFANLVREQFVNQAATTPADERHPNEGRKALLFSDGRQKAARLARDLPREVERDSFREALALAIATLAKLPNPRGAVLDDTLYAAFVSVCAAHHLHFFDGDDQKKLLEECQHFARDYGGDLGLAFDDEWKPSAPTRYRQALLRQIGDPYYSLMAACAAVVEPKANKLRILERHVGAAVRPELTRDVVSLWVRQMLARSAFDPALGRDARRDEFAYFEPIRKDDGLGDFFKKVRARCGLGDTEVESLRSALFDVFTRDGDDDSGRLLLTDAVIVRLALDDIWLQCGACGEMQIKPFAGACAQCGLPRLEPRPPDHPYMVSRKGFFREPLRSVLDGERPVHITAEEHTAQLSQRDAGVVYATTEEFELRFQDVPLGKDKPSVDVLSCTTTMEVGIDIGSLTAVGLRTVPPQRENYQQRAGRAGRRGTSVSTVLTFAQGGAHDAHYFANPAAIISGAPREPRIKSDNQRLARRHINAYLLQTFFHGVIDALSTEEQDELARTRPGIMSAFGTVQEFFTEEGPLSHSAFDDWLRARVLVPTSPVVESAVQWLPRELARGEDRGKFGRKFVRHCAQDLQSALKKLGAQTKPAAADEAGGAAAAADDDTEVGSLLDALFDGGLLPSYAFPTDLCSFSIQEWGENKTVRVKERPQLGKTQALSEYAPGRLLVVNKKTYRVGGIFVDGPPTSSPAKALFSRPLKRYVGCPRCSFVRIEATSAAATPEGTPCPVCKDALAVRDMVDPPGFAPEEAKALREGDRDQDITYASSAQLPELVGRDEFQWRTGAGARIEHAFGEDVLLVVANKGRNGNGFSVCEDCGAAWLDGEEVAGPHRRPFLLPHAVMQREGASWQCSGQIRRAVLLGHEFRTDIFLLRVAVHGPFDFSPSQPWLYDGLATLAEALSLGASLHLDIDPGELSAGFRLLPALDQEKGTAEIYLFDTAAGGAGYAADAGEDLAAVLDRTEALLRDCVCERSCTKCLRHYGNRFVHARLDRRLAQQLLRYARTGDVPGFAPVHEQARLLAPLGRLLDLAGWTVSGGERGWPLEVQSAAGAAIRVGTHPCFIAAADADAQYPLPRRGDARTVLLPDYLVERDLPSALQVIVAPPRATPAAARLESSGANVEAETELRVVDLRTIGSNRSSGITVKLPIKASSSAFAARVPSGVLGAIGLKPGTWLVLRPVAKDDTDGERQLVVLRPRGKFRATGDSWTVARVRRLEDGASRVQLTYGRKEAEFRPERLEAAEITLAAAVIAIVEERR